MADTTRATPENMQHAFDAEIQVSAADIGLYLVVAHQSDGAEMNLVLRSVGAAVAARVATDRVLAVMRYPSFEALRSHRAIALVGPVTLDEQRFALFQQVMGAVQPDALQT